MTNDITDRASWLAFRADWRARYKEASEDVRRAKRDLRGAYEAGREASGYQSSLHYERRAAHGLMVELDKAKELKAKLLEEARPLAA